MEATQLTMVPIQEAIKDHVEDIYRNVREFLNEQLGEIPFTKEELGLADEDTLEQLKRLHSLECLLCI